MMNTSIRNALFWYSRLRSANFAIQYWAFNQVSAAIGMKAPVEYYEDKELFAEVQTAVDDLLRADVERIEKGIYPASVLIPDLSLKVLNRFPKVLLDSFRVGRRRTQGSAKEFSSAARKYFEGLPSYYLRNFHYQTDGYLAEGSAEVYDYEVELLFSGTADAMRRLIIAPLKEHFKDAPEGQGLKFLEIGAGTGRATRFVRQAFPKAKIVALDLSEPYLRVAQRNLKSFYNISFLQGDGASLPFKDEEFDAVYSVFLFHEMPLEVRTRVMKESLRVLKRKGFLGFVDSIQKGDNPRFDDFLKDFPKNFHEPFYNNYMLSPMEELFHAIPVEGFRTEKGLLSKVGSATKIA